MFWKMPPADIPRDLKAGQTMGRGANGGRGAGDRSSAKALQQPHPPIIQPFHSSEPAIRWCARNRVQPILAPVNDPLESFLFAVYHDETNKAERNLEPGDAHEAVTPEAMHEGGLMWIGSPATVRRQVEQPLERLPLKYAPVWQYNGVTPRPAIAKSLQLFADEVVAQL